MAGEEKCVLCGRGEVEDVEHFLVRYDEFQWKKLERIREIEGDRGISNSWCSKEDSIDAG